MLQQWKFLSRDVKHENSVAQVLPSVCDRIIYYYPSRTDFCSSSTCRVLLCESVNLAEKVLIKDDEYWKQSSCSLSSFATQKALLHSLMELYMQDHSGCKEDMLRTTLYLGSKHLRQRLRKHNKETGEGISPSHRMGMDQSFLPR